MSHVSRSGADLIELAATWCESAAETESSDAVAALWRTRAKMLRDGYQPLIARAAASERRSTNAAPQASGLSEHSSVSANPAVAAPASSARPSIHPEDLRLLAAGWVMEIAGAHRFDTELRKAAEAWAKKPGPKDDTDVPTLLRSILMGGVSAPESANGSLKDIGERLIAALEDRKSNCDKSARSYLADGQVTSSVQCRSAAGAVQECIDAVTNILRSEWQWFGSAEDNGARSEGTYAKSTVKGAP